MILISHNNTRFSATKNIDAGERVPDGGNVLAVLTSDSTSIGTKRDANRFRRRRCSRSLRSRLPLALN